MTDSEAEIEEEKGSHRPKPVPLSKTFLVIAAFLWVLGLTGMCLLGTLVPRKLDESYQRKAKSLPDLRNPPLNVFRVPYNNESHTVSPFWIYRVGHSLGTISHSTQCNVGTNGTVGIPTGQHLYALGEDLEWIDLFINDDLIGKVEQVTHR